MTDNFNLISILYELSVATQSFSQPALTAQVFLEKILSRKNLNYGAIWMIDKIENDQILFSKLYSIPTVEKKKLIPAANFKEFFKYEALVNGKKSIFPNDDRQGDFVYFKLGEIGLLELFNKRPSKKLEWSAIYPLKDVFNQLARSLESGFFYQKLEEEIEHRKAAEKTMISTQEKYRRIVDNIELGLLEVDENETIQHANESFCELTGFTLEDLKGKNASNLLISEDSRDLMLKQNQNRKEGKSGVYELPIITKSGEMRWAIISGAPNYDNEGNIIGSIGIHLDITNQKRLSEQISFQTSMVQNLFKVSLDGLISINQAGEIIEWNPQAERIFLYSKEEMIGKKLSDTIIPHNFRDAHVNGMKKYNEEGVGPVLNQRIEISGMRKNGEVFPIELTIFPIKHGKENFFTAFVRDISERIRANEELENTLTKQTELTTMMSRFISMTSHELRTPLTTISSDTEILNYYIDQLDNENKNRLSKSISRIGANVDRLNELINNILVIGKMESNEVPIFAAKIDIFDFITNQIISKYSAQDRPIQFKMEGDPFDAEVDKRLLTHILENLIENAYKYSENKPAPHLKLEFLDDSFIITIKDYGIGIPKEDHGKMFNTFFRASNVGSIQGTGLGLSIVKEFIVLHKGSISFDSKIGEGTTFTLKFRKNL